MKYAVARKYAEDCVNWLRPFCERIEMAGSIRRGRAECNDVDLVVVPKVWIERDMFQNPVNATNLLKKELERYVSETPGARWLNGTGVTTSATVNFLVGLRKCELNVFCAKEENFGAVWLTYTGSRESNLWMIERALGMSLQWGALRGVFDGSRWHGRTEEEIYQRLNMPFIEPSDREIEKMRKLLMAA
jgi:DNA polymerase/3'-5' exonuclease PolX